MEIVSQAGAERALSLRLLNIRAARVELVVRARLGPSHYGIRLELPSRRPRLLWGLVIGRCVKLGTAVFTACWPVGGGTHVCTVTKKKKSKPENSLLEERLH